MNGYMDTHSITHKNNNVYRKPWNFLNDISELTLDHDMGDKQEQFMLLAILIKQTCEFWASIFEHANFMGVLNTQRLANIHF